MYKCIYGLINFPPLFSFWLNRAVIEKTCMLNFIIIIIIILRNDVLKEGFHIQLFSICCVLLSFGIIPDN